MVVYLDYNATTPLDASVCSVIKNSFVHWANPSSNYPTGVEAKKIISEARKHIASMINARGEDIVFTSGGTEANNMVLFGVLHYFKDWLNDRDLTRSCEKPHVITTNVEHDSVILPLKHLQKKGEIDLTIVPVLSGGCISEDDILREVRRSTCLITVMLANNETGVIMPVEKIGRALKEINKQRQKDGGIGILFHTDAAQAMGKIHVDVDVLQVDYMTIVGHKETFEDDVIINCNTDVKRLPNTCNISFRKKDLFGHVVLSKCSNIMASVGAACHAQNKPSGILIASGVAHSLALNAIRLSVGRETSKSDIDIAVSDLQAAVLKIKGEHSN
ncbi:Selenocysteine lyase [Blattella germanica]|nr:Selenocysteine lyase [Blattella germanica]